MAAHNYTDLLRHVGHEIECVTYGEPPVNVSIECVECYEVIIDYDAPEGGLDTVDGRQ